MLILPLLVLLRRLNFKQLTNLVFNKVFFYLLLGAIALAVGTALRTLAENAQNIWLYFLSTALIEFWAYCTICYSSLTLKPKNISNQKNLIRPIAALLLVITCTLELACLYIAGPQSVSQFSKVTDVALPSNIWLFFYVELGLIYIVGCLIVFSLETIVSIRNFRGPNRAAFTFSHGLLVTYAFMGMLYFGLYALGLAIYEVLSQKEILSLTNLSHIVVILIFIPINFVAVIWYQWLKERVTAIENKLVEKYSKEARWLYEKSLEIFPTPHEKNVYTLAAYFSTNWLVKGIVKELTDKRVKFLTAETQRKANLKEVEVWTLAKTDPIPFEGEVVIWAYFLSNAENEELAYKLLSQLQTSIDVPELKYSGTRYLIAYYARLSKAVKRQFEQSNEFKDSQPMAKVTEA